MPQPSRLDRPSPPSLSDLFSLLINTVAPYNLSPRDLVQHFPPCHSDVIRRVPTGGAYSFLTTCAECIGEGPHHLNLLDAILELGFDPTTIHSPLWEQWPASCSPNWISEHDTPDPFFVEYLATLVNDNPGAYLTKLPAERTLNC